jgi:hypothetical protein
MRNQIGIPPMEPSDEGPATTPAVRKPAPAVTAAASDAPAGHRKPLRYTGDDTGTAPRESHRNHAGMEPEVREGARKADVADVGTSLTHPITERDANSGLYIGLVIGAIAAAIIVMVLTAIF